MLEGFGSEIGLFNTVLIGLFGSFFVFLIKNLGPPWKWGKLIRDIEAFRKEITETRENPGTNTLYIKATAFEEFKKLCVERHEELTKDIEEIKERVLFLERRA